MDERREWALVTGGRTSVHSVRFEGPARYCSAGFHSFFGGSASSVGMRDEVGLALAASGRNRRSHRWKLFHDRHRRSHRSGPGGVVARRVEAGARSVGETASRSQFLAALE